MANDRRFVGVVLAWQIAASGCYYTVFAATPFFRAAFSLSGVAVGAIVTVLTLGYTAFLLPAGSILEARGERVTLLVSLLALAVAVVAVTVVPTYPALLVVMVCLGAAYASAIPGTNKAVLEGVHERHRNLALGVKQVGVTAGSALAALVVTGLAGSWRTGFLAVAILAVGVDGVFALCYRPRDPEPNPADANRAIDSDRTGGGERTENGTGTETGNEATAADERTLVVLRRLFGGRAYRRLTMAGFFLGAALFTTVGYTVLYVSESVGASIAFGGIVLASVQAGGSVGRIGAGWLGDHLPGTERRATTRVLLAQAAFGTVLLVGVTQVDSRVGALVGFSVLGVCVLGFTGIYYSCMGTLVPENRIASATAGGQVALNAGALVAPPAFGLLVDFAGYHEAWLLLAACGAIATALLVGVERESA